MLSLRSLKLLMYIAERDEVPLHMLLAFFLPEEAIALRGSARAPHALQAATFARARQALRRLEHAALVVSSPHRATDTSFRLTQKGAALLGVRAVAAVHPRARAHHAATVAFIERLRASLPAGQQLAGVTFESGLRREVQAGRATERGTSFASFPDAVVLIESHAPSGDAPGAATRERVAVEYVTSKYTSRDIVDKARSFSADYDRVLWVADTARTAARVTSLVGAGCACLS